MITNLVCLVIFAGALVVALHWPAEYKTTMLDKILLALVSISCGMGLVLSLAQIVFEVAQRIGNLVANPGVGL